MIKQVESISLKNRFLNAICNGLFLWGIRNRMALVGFDFKPYYWAQEETKPCEEPQIKGNKNEYLVRFLNSEEVHLIAKNIPNNQGQDLLAGFNNGQWCIGLEYKNEIAAYTFVELHDFTFNHRVFKLKENEAYLLNMFTFHKFRGKSLAPYLRYHCYQLLKEKGINTKYSITEYFNKSSIKFKNKLNSKHLNLFLSIVLFKKYYWNFMLKKY